MKLIVTGAGGFLGAAVAAAGARAGHQVVAVTRRPGAARLEALNGVKPAVVDIGDSEAIDRLFATERPDVVVHSAWAGLSGAERDGIGQIDQMHAFCRMMLAAARHGVRKTIGIGSQAEYGLTTGRTDETMLPQPVSLYGAAKLSAGIMGARLAASTGMDFAWLRVFALYGPGDNGHWLIPSVLATLREGRSPRLTPGTQRVDYLFIDDAAAAVLAVATTAGANGTFNLASGDAVTVRDIVEQLRDLAAPDLALTFGAVPFGASQVMHIEGVIDRITAATGWRPATTLRAGLTQTAAFPRHKGLRSTC